MKRVFIFLIIIVGVVSFLVFKKDSISPENKELKIGTKIGNLAPNFELADYNDQKISLADFKDSKPVFINFWASWCSFCVEEMPLMAEIQKQFGDQYVTLAINRGEDQATGQQFTNSLGVTNDFILLNDKSDSIYSLYGGFAMPFSIFIDKNGVIRAVKLGPLNKEELIQKIQKII